MSTSVVSQGGRVVIPKPFRKRLGVKEGDTVFFAMHDGEVVVTTRRARLERARALLSRHNPEGVSLVDELLAERRAEAAREDGP